MVKNLESLYVHEVGSRYRLSWSPFQSHGDFATRKTNRWEKVVYLGSRQLFDVLDTEVQVQRD